MDWSELARTSLIVLYTFSLVAVSVYGIHRYGLLYLYFRHRRKSPERPDHFEQLPRLTVQLPMYNEESVAQRVIECACRLEYPRDRLDIQVLDDSVDGTRTIAEAAVAEARQQGFDICYIHREDRTGYKAGALANGLKTAKGEFVAIFDADFLPDPGFLKRAIHYFTDDSVAVVQTRWEHLNREDSLLTKSQAILLDGHFAIEHVARNRSNRFINFNGTAGLWRMCAIADAGGWHHDTLTEDLDLSFRAQMRGWKFVYLPEQTAPAELPPEMTAFKAQQFRWTKGGAQTALKLLPRVLLSRLPLKVKLEGFFHLTSFSLHIYVSILVVLMFPALMLRVTPDLDSRLFRIAFDLSVLTLATISGSLFYLTGQVVLLRNWRSTLLFLPMLMALGVGMCVSNTKALLEALMGKPSEFVRTPKYGVGQAATAAAPKKRKKLGWLPYVEFGMGLYMIACAAWSFAHYQVALLTTPFLMLFAFGFFYVSILSFQSRAVPAAAEKPALEGAYVSESASVAEPVSADR
ncbi:MAG: glycosyltransferase [Planctomycetota bacterium]